MKLSGGGKIYGWILAGVGILLAAFLLLGKLSLHQPAAALVFKTYNLWVFVSLLVYFGREPARLLFAERRNRIDRRIHEAWEALETSRREWAAAEAERQQLQSRQSAILSEAEAAGRREKERLIERARELAELLRAASRNAAAMEEAALRRQLLLESLDQAIAGTKNRLQRELPRQAQAQQVEQFVREVRRRG